jgi:hypothetical protein
MTICLPACKLRKLQVEWYWIWKGCNPYGIFISTVVETNIMSGIFMPRNFYFLYKIDLKN